VGTQIILTQAVNLGIKDSTCRLTKGLCEIMIRSSHTAFGCHVFISTLVSLRNHTLQHSSFLSVTSPLLNGEGYSRIHSIVEKTDRKGVAGSPTN
jgi:hypothetical protein